MYFPGTIKSVRFAHRSSAEKKMQCNANFIPDSISDLRRLHKYRMVVGVWFVDDSFHITMIVENVAVYSMLVFVVAYVVAPD